MASLKNRHQRGGATMALTVTNPPQARKVWVKRVAQPLTSRRPNTKHKLSLNNRRDLKSLIIGLGTILS